MEGSKGQVAIWVIVAIVLVAVIGLIFFISQGGGPSIARGGDFNPENFIDSCLRESVQDNVDLMLPQGGFVNPGDYHLYNNIKVAYVCKNINNFEPCVNQYPAFGEQVGRELARAIDDNLTNCFSSLQIELEERNYEYSASEHEIDVELKPEIIEITVHKDFSFSKGGEETRFESFTSRVQSPLGKLADVVGNFLIYEESQRCYAENLGWVLLYGEKKGIDIKKTESYDSTSVYSVIDTKTRKQMNVAIRGCVVAHGFYGV